MNEGRQYSIEDTSCRCLERKTEDRRTDRADDFSRRYATETLLSIAASISSSTTCSKSCTSSRELENLISPYSNENDVIAEVRCSSCLFPYFVFCSDWKVNYSASEMCRGINQASRANKNLFTWIDSTATPAQPDWRQSYRHPCFAFVQFNWYFCLICDSLGSKLIILPHGTSVHAGCWNRRYTDGLIRVVRHLKAFM